MSEAKKNTTPLIVLTVLLAAGVFLLDLSLPLGVAGGVPYVIVVLISSWLPRERDTLIAATVGTVLTILGFYYSPSGSELWIVIFNRILAICVIWVTAILSLRHKRSQEKLRRNSDHLEKLLEERTTEVPASEDRFKTTYRSGVAVYSAVDDGENFAFIDFNPAGERIDKIAAKDIIGQPVTAAILSVASFSGSWRLRLAI